MPCGHGHSHHSCRTVPSPAPALAPSNMAHLACAQSLPCPFPRLECPHHVSWPISPCGDVTADRPPSVALPLQTAMVSAGSGMGPQGYEWGELRPPEPSLPAKVHLPLSQSTPEWVVITLKLCPPSWPSPTWKHFPPSLPGCSTQASCLEAAWGGGPAVQPQAQGPTPLQLLQALSQVPGPPRHWPLLRGQLQ